MAPNEARRREDLPPVDGGDTPYLQVQNYSLAALANRDAREAVMPAPGEVKQLPSAQEYRRERELLNGPAPKESAAEEEFVKLRDRVDRAESILKSIGLISQKLPERLIPSLRR